VLNNSFGIDRRDAFFGRALPGLAEADEHAGAPLDVGRIAAQLLRCGRDRAVQRSKPSGELPYRTPTRSGRPSYGEVVVPVPVAVVDCPAAGFPATLAT
jgi:hypothetical protein